MKTLLPCLLLTAAVASLAPLHAQPLAPAYAPPSNKTVLTTTFVDWDSLAVKKTKAGESRAVFDNPTPTLEKFEVHITTLNPGMISHPVHQHPWEEMLLIKEGKVEVSINGQKYPAGPGYLVFFASHDPHNLKNVGDTPATYYVINFYTDLVHTVADKPASEQAVPGKLPSSVIDCNGLRVEPTKTGSRIVVLNAHTLTFPGLGNHLTTLNPGQSTARDINDTGDELFILRSGTLEASAHNVSVRLTEGSLFYFAPNDRRTFKNIGTTPATYQVFKVTSANSPKEAGG